MLSIFNLLGEKVKEEKVTGNQVTLHVSSLPQGLYLMRAENKIGGQVCEGIEVGLFVIKENLRETFYLNLTFLVFASDFVICTARRMDMVERRHHTTSSNGLWYSGHP